MKLATQQLQNADPIMARIIERVGPYRLAVREPTFETLARSIAFQQLNGKAAATILRG
jgi:DNA-3-methyladenine glycosylase II